MKLEMVGCSHHEAAVEFRERISFSGEQVGRALGAFRDRFPTSELVLLSTCNRVELYAAPATPVGNGQTRDPVALADRDGITGLLADLHGLPRDEIARHMIHREGPQAVRHLFQVAASLDSMVVGEAQILSQVKTAYELARERDSAGPLLHAAFQAAQRTAKRVQNETSIHRRRLSVPSVAVGEVIPEVFDSLRGKCVVVCGAGEMGKETMRYLIDAGADDIRVLNRNFDRAVNLVQTGGGRAERWETLSEQIVAADVLIGTTSAHEPIVDAARFASLHERRRSRMLLILDLAVPRDFEHAVGDFDSVFLYGIDDLKAACERNRHERQKELPKANAIVDEETQKFIASIRHRATGPVIRQLRGQAAQVKSDELRRLMNKLGPDGLNATASKEIEKSFDRMINKLLHPPLASIRDDAAEGHQEGLLDALRQLFKLGDD